MKMTRMEQGDFHEEQLGKPGSHDVALFPLDSCFYTEQRAVPP